MTRSLCLKLGMLLGAGVGLLWWTDLGGPGVGSAPASFGGEPAGAAADPDADAVFVMQLGSRSALAEVRRQLDATRIVAATDEAIALREGFVLATGFEAASPVINAAGFAERELKLFSPRAASAPPGARSERERASLRGGASRGELDALANGGPLSPGEALAALHAISNGY